MLNFFKHFGLVWALLVLCVSLHLPASARVLYVSPDGESDGVGASWATAFQSIGSALTASASGDQVWVRSATYPEAIVLVEGIALYGGFPASGSPSFNDRDWQSHETIIDATGIAETSAVTWAEGGLMDGFVIRGGKAQYGGGIYCQQGTMSLQNCRIEQNSAWKHGGGIYIKDATSIIQDCVIQDNRKMNNESLYYGGGIYATSSSVRLIRCKLVENEATWFGGGLSVHLSEIIMEECLIKNNQALRGACGFLTSCTLISCTRCQFLDNTSNYSGQDLEVFDVNLRLESCLLVKNTSFISYTTALLINCTIVDNSYINNNFNAEISIINTILLNEVAIQEGISTANCNIRQKLPGVGNIMAPPLFVDAANGDYRLQDGSPCIDRGLVTGAPTTDLDGNVRPGSDGKVDIGAYESPDEYEPGMAYKPMYVRADALPGGDGSSWADALPTITEALASATRGTDIWVAAGHYPEAITLKPQVYLYGGFRGDEEDWEKRANLFEETIIDAAGLNQSVVTASDWTELNGFTLTGGSPYYGGGLYCLGTSPLVQNCIIRNCQARTNGGGIHISRSAPLFVNCLIMGNTALVDGGAISIITASPRFINCTIVDNQAGNHSGGLYLVDYTLTTLQNSILKNTGNEITTFTTIPNVTPTAEISHSAIEGGFEGLNNTSDDPLFINEAAGDFRLQAGSPCIDQGSNELVLDLYHRDLAGHYRIWGGDDEPGAVVDMGVYEYGSVPILDYYGDLDSNGQINKLDLFLFSTHWFEPNNETSFNYNPEPGEYVDEADLLHMIKYLKEGMD